MTLDLSSPDKTIAVLYKAIKAKDQNTLSKLFVGDETENAPNLFIYSEKTKIVTYKINSNYKNNFNLSEDDYVQVFVFEFYQNDKRERSFFVEKVNNSWLIVDWFLVEDGDTGNLEKIIE